MPLFADRPSIPLQSHTRLAIGKFGEFVLHKAVRGKRLPLDPRIEDDATCKY